MLTKAKVQVIKSLEQKRSRDETGLFVAEGEKIAYDLLKSDLDVAELFCTEAFADEYEMLLSNRGITPNLLSPSQLDRISMLNTPPEVIALARIPQGNASEMLSRGGLFIALDRIQDPGNVGTIIRSGEWFGFDGVLCGEGCADPYSPKVVQSAMGSLFRMKVVSTNLLPLLSGTSLPLMAAALEGESIYEVKLPKEGVVLIGNESQGLSDVLLELATLRVTIPPVRRSNTAGLNAAVAGAVIMSVLARG